MDEIAPKMRRESLIEEFHIVGITHRRAPIEVRERLAVAPPEWEASTRQLCEQSGIAEAVILPSCLRSEFYVCGPRAEARAGVEEFWRVRFRVRPEDFRRFALFRSGPEAVRHLFHVLAGLDSLFVGEHQMRRCGEESLAAAECAGAAGPVLRRIFTAALQSAAEIQSETRLGRRNITKCQAVVEMVEKIFGSLENRTVLLLGGGHACEPVIRDLKRAAPERILASSPEEAEAAALARLSGRLVTVLPWKDVLAAASEADVVINTSITEPKVLRRADYEKIRPLRQKRALFLLDMAMPRGFDPALKTHGEVFLYTIDDMAGVAQSYQNRYSNEIEEAEAIADRNLEQFLRELETNPLPSPFAEIKSQY